MDHDLSLVLPDTVEKTRKAGGTYAVWLSLVAVTLLSTVSRSEAFFTREVLSTFIAVVAVGKCFVVGWFFMEIRHGPLRWKVMLAIWVTIVFVVVTLGVVH